MALHARAKGEPRERDLVLVNAMRGSPYVVPRKDVAVFTAALVPDDDGLKALVGSQVAKEAAAAGFTPREALDRVSEAAREGLAGGPLDRDAFHQAMRERLPEGLLPWCRGCKSHHVRPGFWRALGPLGVTEMPGRATYALARPPRMALVKAQAELVRRFLRCFGPATHTDLAGWAQTAPAHAKQLFGAIEDELDSVDGKRFILAAERKRYDSPPAARGVRLLGGYDPYVAQPDREALAPDAALRKKLFPAVGRPGVVLHDGALAGVWRSRKKGEVLEVEVDWLDEEVDISAEAELVARLRDCSYARLR